MFINRIRMFFPPLVDFCSGKHQKVAYQISFLGPARFKPLILAVIGWPLGSQVITLTVLAGGGRQGGGRRTRHSSQIGSSGGAADRAIVFLFEISVGSWPSAPTALHFHFQLRRKI